mgnify:CR=1 FL=1
MRLRFNQLPSDKIIKFLKEIVVEENLKFTDIEIKNIQELFQSDIRSMINYMQSNQLAILNTKVIDKSIFKSIDNMLQKKDNKKFKSKASILFRMTLKTIYIMFLNFLN